MVWLQTENHNIINLSQILAIPHASLLVSFRTETFDFRYSIAMTLCPCDTMLINMRTKEIKDVSEVVLTFPTSLDVAV